jgi:hypothetical protein
VLQVLMNRLDVEDQEDMPRLLLALSTADAVLMLKGRLPQLRELQLDVRLMQQAAGGAVQLTLEVLKWAGGGGVAQQLARELLRWRVEGVTGFCANLAVDVELRGGMQLGAYPDEEVVEGTVGNCKLTICLQP